MSAYDNTLESVETLDAAQAKFDDILTSPSVDAACEKIKSLAKAKELDSSLILLINSAYAVAKESETVTNEVIVSPKQKALIFYNLLISGSFHRSKSYIFFNRLKT